jgi:hypothetical protein
LIMSYPEFLDAKVVGVKRHMKKLNFYDGIYSSFTIYLFDGKLWMFYQGGEKLEKHLELNLIIGGT